MKKAALVALLLASACGRPAAEPPPGCEPPGPTPYTIYNRVAIPGWDKDELSRDVVAIDAAIRVSEGAGAPPSKEFVEAKRAFDAERWIDAGQGFREVAKRNGADDRATRRDAQYFFAVALYQLKFFSEAGAIFRQIKATEGHARRESATTWLTNKFCER